MTNFYRAFEDRHRGSRELIKSRLTAYVPFLAPLPAVGFPCEALDLGCGRGEWLELLGERGFVARGVDLDDGMLAACRERGLDVSTDDALTALRAQPDASLVLVSAFHLIEHVPFDVVQELISQALRVLRPGGLLILETPNPENVVVGASNFYTDPSHLRPVPPLLLDFAVEFAGFARHKVVRLQEPASLRGTGPVELLNVFNGASPDYSVVAQKAAEQAIGAAFDPAFDTSFGLDLAELAQRYDAQRESERSDAQLRITQLSERIAAAELSTGNMFQRALEATGEAHGAARVAEAELHHARQREKVLEVKLEEQRQALETIRQSELRAIEAERQAMQRIVAAEQQVLHTAAEARQLAVLRDVEVAQHVELLKVELEKQAASLVAEADQKIALLLADASQHAESRLEEAKQRAESRLAEAEQRAVDRAIQTDQERVHADAQLQHVIWQLNEMTVRAQTAEQKVSDLYASSSWRLTSPARAAASLLRGRIGAADVARMVAARNKARAGRMLMPLVRKLARHPGARTLAMRTLAHFPALEGRVRSLTYRALHGAPAYVPPVAAQVALPVPPGHAPQIETLPLMSQSAQKVFTELQRAPSNDQPFN